MGPNVAIEVGPSRTIELSQACDGRLHLREAALEFLHYMKAVRVEFSPYIR
ncbi:MAG: hypothetical protein IT168_25080 [Bryobacterales bacterium]|nr:hypothetical protein [Bryobacterales bacterium]